MGRNNSDKDWKNVNSLFKRRFRCHRVVGSMSPYSDTGRAHTVLSACSHLTMVSSKAVNYVKIIPECLLILGSNQRGLDPRPLDANSLGVIFSKKQMVRRHFTRDLDSFLFSRTNNKHLKKCSFKKIFFKNTSSGKVEIVFIALNEKLLFFRSTKILNFAFLKKKSRDVCG